MKWMSVQFVRCHLVSGTASIIVGNAGAWCVRRARRTGLRFLDSILFGRRLCIGRLCLRRLCLFVWLMGVAIETGIGMEMGILLLVLVLVVVRARLFRLRRSIQRWEEARRCGCVIRACRIRILNRRACLCSRIRRAIARIIRCLCQDSGRRMALALELAYPLVKVPRARGGGLSGPTTTHVSVD